MAGQMIDTGKKIAKEVLADITDASVPIKFRDFHVLIVAEAKFSDKTEENVFYVGCFYGWYNLSNGAIRMLISFESFLVLLR